MNHFSRSQYSQYAAIVSVVSVADALGVPKFTPLSVLSDLTHTPTAIALPL